MATRDLGRLAKSVKAHRMQQYPSRDAAAEAAGVARNTWKRVEEGLGVRESTYARIDKALGWSIGSCAAIAAGGNPVLVDDGPADGTAPAKPISEAEARRLVFDAARAKMPASTPIGNLDAFSDEIVEIMRRAGAVREDT